MREKNLNKQNRNSNMIWTMKENSELNLKTN